MQPATLRTAFAADQFLAVMRRKWMERNVGEECPIKRLADYPPADRAALVQALAVAMHAATSENMTSVFETWKAAHEGAI